MRTRAKAPVTISAKQPGCSSTNPIAAPPTTIAAAIPRINMGFHPWESSFDWGEDHLGPAEREHDGPGFARTIALLPTSTGAAHVELVEVSVSGCGGFPSFPIRGRRPSQRSLCR
jgi:hypothetical protein